MEQMDEALPPEKELKWRAEVDFSAPFDSVKEAVDRFGGSALWKSQLKRLFEPVKHHPYGEVDVMKVEEQRVQLEKDLMVKERETLNVLKELEMTKGIVDELKLKLLQKEALQATEISNINLDSERVLPPESEENIPQDSENQPDFAVPNVGGKQSPGSILMELKQAKVNLSRTTSDMAGVRASIELLNRQIEEEKSLLEKTRNKLTTNTAKVSDLEEDLNQTTLKLQLIRNAENKQKSLDPLDISEKIKALNSEIEQFKKMTESTKSEISKLIAEIEQTKASTKTAEIRWLAAKKMEEAARAAEASALAEIRALTNIDYSSASGITLPVEEYIMLTCKAEEADQVSRKKIEAAMLEVEEANRSKEDLVMKVEEAKKEVKTSRKVLDEALTRVEVANRAKLAVEEALRKWRSEHGQRRRSLHNPAKFKNPGPAQHRRDSRMFDLNGISLVADTSRGAVTIGQILSKKLTGFEDCNTENMEKVSTKPKVSLGQMLTKGNGVVSPPRSDNGSARKQFPAKKKKFGIVGLLILANQNRKSKKKKKKKKLQVCRPR